MASSVRRTLRSYSYLNLLRSTASVPCRYASYMTTSSRCQGYYASCSANSCAYAINFIHEARRGFAKGRRQMKFEEDYDQNEGNMMPRQTFGPDTKAAAQSQMEVAIDALSRGLGKLRTGRA